jgi:CHAT domain-containing protein
VRRLFIVPHASLAYLPFAALMNPQSRRYLVEQFELTMLPSGGALPTLRQRHGASGTAVADNMSGSAVRARLFAPFPVDLPGTGAEIAALERIIPGAIASLGAQATERAVRAALSTTAIVHVATHGTLNARSPMFSRLELARATSASPELDDDGALEVRELLDMPIRSPLVYLSGCETGTGAAWSTSYMRGDDYTTLAAAFLFAGARDVVSTLWRIEDRGASVFATTFYRELASRSPAAALAGAQRSLIANPAYRSPFYWAAYVISGDGGSAPAQMRWGPSVE